MPSNLHDSILKAYIKNASTPRASEPYASLCRDALKGRESAPSGLSESILRALTHTSPTSSGLSGSILKAFASKPKVFVSYHHGRDRRYYEQFSHAFSDSYDVCHDNSVDREIDSEDCDYVIRAIRENYVTGTSCTVVLCGAETRWRKFVDWEIKATLDKKHALIGVNLPTNPRDPFGGVHKPDRLQDNIDSGFAGWVEWNALIAGGPGMLRTALQAARLSSTGRIRNSRILRTRNG